MVKTYPKFARIEGHQFLNTKLFNARRFRLIPAQVNDERFVPVVTVGGDRTVCKMPMEFEGRQVGILDCSSTNVFDLKTGNLLCHIFDANNLFDLKKPKKEPKHEERNTAIIFGDRYHVEYTSIDKLLDLKEFLRLSLPATSAYTDQVNLAKEFFYIKLFFHIKNLYPEIMAADLELNYDAIREAEIGNKDLSSVILGFKFSGECLGSKWDINLGTKKTEKHTDFFPFTWKNLTAVCD